MQLTARHTGILQGQSLLKLMMGGIPYISEYLNVGWSYRVWFKEDTGLRENQIGLFLGPLHKVGSLMSYWIFPASGIPVYRTRVQRVTYLETCTNNSKKRFKVYEKAIKGRFHEKFTEEAFAGHNTTRPTMEIWDGLAEDDKDFQSGFNKVFDNPDVKESDK